MKHFYFFIVFSLFFQLTYGQINNAYIAAHLVITKPSNVLAVSDNGNGTITLTHAEQYITDIFAKYEITSFYQFYSNLYQIRFNNRDLLVDIKNMIPSEIISVSEGSYSSKLPINAAILDMLDNKKFTAKQYCWRGESNWYTCGENINNTNDTAEMNITVDFNYDESMGLLWVNRVGDETCTKTFSIAFSGDEDFGDSYSLEVWKIVSSDGGMVGLSENLCSDEGYLLDALNAINPAFGLPSNPKVKLEQDYAFSFRSDEPTFSYHTVYFEADTMSTEKYSFSNLKFYEDTNSPYLMFSDNTNESLYLKIHSITGQEVLSQTALKENSVKIDNLSSGLYFITVSDVSGRNAKVIKFLKQ